MKTGLIFAALLVAASGAANADPRDDALTAMQRCSTLSDRDRRLGCFDATMARAPGAAMQIRPVSALPGATGPEVSASLPPPAPPPAKRSSGLIASIFGDGPARDPQTTVAQFGSESIANGGAHANPIAIRGDTINQISARLAAASFSGGFIIVTLDNGQVWRQTAGADSLGSLSKPPSSYTVVIARGNFDGSYAMRLSGMARLVAVRRIR
jgi:hypothetical protein